MKILFAVVIGSICLVAFYRLFAINSRKSIESYKYQLIKKYETFEIRQYEAGLFTAVTLPTNDYKQASGQGFRKLAGYIFGGNESNQKIAMTTPVAMTLDDSMTMMFMVPKEWKKEDLPTPNSADIAFKEVPAKKVAAIRFSGWANNERLAEYKDKLMEALKKEGIKHTGRFYFFGYNPPYDLVDRRNEVIVELTD